MGKKWDSLRTWIGKSVASGTSTVIGKTNTNLVIYTVVCLAILWMVSLKQPNDPRIWNQFLIAMGAAASGCIFGFVYASVGKERDDFKPIFAALNGVLGGAAVLDLSKGSGSMIRTFIWSLSKACGYTDGIAIIVMIILTFWTLGFLALYYNRKLLLNAEAAAADYQMESMTSKDAAGEKLRTFWKPDGTTVNPSNEQRLNDWMKANSLDKIPITFFLNSRDHAEQRKRAVEELKL
jgi:hypothetical protein